MSNVLPGVDDVFASFLLRASILIRLDLPTFERPINAYSGFVSLGHIETRGDDSVNSAVLISMGILKIRGDSLFPARRPHVVCVNYRILSSDFTSFSSFTIPFLARNEKNTATIGMIANHSSTGLRTAKAM